MARVHLVIPAHLAMSPRGQREAMVLQEAGYEVTVSGVWFDERQAEIDRELAARQKLRFKAAVDMRRSVASMRRMIERVRGRWARERFRRHLGFTPELLGYGVRTQLRDARDVRADLTVVHGETGLWIGEQLQREGLRVGVDFEDWYSCDLPEQERHTRPVQQLARLERVLLRGSAYRLASSERMACELAQAYAVKPPAVVTNAGPPIFDAPSKRDTGSLRLIWFSQTIGPARGLELLFAALPLVHSSVKVTLLGGCTAGHRAWIEQIIPPSCRDAVVIAPAVPTWELATRVAEHDVGLALETCSILNRDLCIPNKFFQYLACGLPVIATRTAGLREALAPCPEAGILLDETRPETLAAAIDWLAENPSRLSKARAAARNAARGVWNGEREREVIVAEAWRALAG